MKKHLPKIIALLSSFAPALAAKIALKMFATPTRIPRPESEMAVYGKSKKYLLSNGIAAFEWGNPTDPLVMLIHGWNGRGTQIGAFSTRLVELGFRVVALDGPGHGISPEGPNGMTNPGHYAEFITLAQKELDPSGAHAVIAHSFGGGCSVLAAKRGFKVKGMVLVGTPNFYERVVTFFGKSFGLNDKGLKHFFSLVTKVAGLKPSELITGEIGNSLNIPCLVVHDKDDNAVNIAAAESIHEQWKGSKIIITEGLGHRRILKDPKVIAEVCDFIKSIP